MLSCSRDRVQERVDEILRLEGYRTGVVNYKLDKTLAALINQTNGDLCNTVNTVQFLATTNQLASDEPVLVSNQVKDKCENLFNLAEFVMFDKPERSSYTVLETVRNMVNSLAGDTQLINDSIYENFSQSCQFYDDNFNKTAYLLQCLSNSDLQETFIGRT